MSHKAIKDLPPCKFCGGKGELHKTRKTPRISHMGIENGYSFYIRCEKCHSRTQAFRDIPNAIQVWTLGHYYPLRHEGN